MNTLLIQFIPRDRSVNQAEVNRQTVIEWAPDSAQADVYRNLAKKITDNNELNVPTPLTFAELENLVMKYGNE